MTRSPISPYAVRHVTRTAAAGAAPLVRGAAAHSPARRRGVETGGPRRPQACARRIRRRRARAPSPCACALSHVPDTAEAARPAPPPSLRREALDSRGQVPCVQTRAHAEARTATGAPAAVWERAIRALGGRLALTHAQTTASVSGLCFPTHTRAPTCAREHVKRGMEGGIGAQSTITLNHLVSKN